MRIAIDAGHGYNTAGKRTPVALGEEWREWTLNSTIADLVCEYLKKYDCQFFRTDDVTGKTDVSLTKRVAACNKDADLVISIHHNAAGRIGNHSGIVVYHSGKHEPIANFIYKSLISATGLVGNRSNPLPVTKTLTMVRKTKAPCFLLELGFMDSKIDYPIITGDTYPIVCAKAIVAAIVAYYKIQPKNDSSCNCNCNCCK